METLHQGPASGCLSGGPRPGPSPEFQDASGWRDPRLLLLPACVPPRANKPPGSAVESRGYAGRKAVPRTQLLQGPGCHTGGLAERGGGPRAHRSQRPEQSALEVGQGSPHPAEQGVSAQGTEDAGFGFLELV